MPLVDKSPHIFATLHDLFNGCVSQGAELHIHGGVRFLSVQESVCASWPSNWLSTIQQFRLNVLDGGNATNSVYVAHDVKSDTYSAGVIYYALAPKFPLVRLLSRFYQDLPVGCTCEWVDRLATVRIRSVNDLRLIRQFVRSSLVFPEADVSKADSKMLIDFNVQLENFVRDIVSVAVRYENRFRSLVTFSISLIHGTLNGTYVTKRGRAFEAHQPNCKRVYRFGVERSDYSEEISARLCEAADAFMQYEEDQSEVLTGASDD